MYKLHTSICFLAFALLAQCCRYWLRSRSLVAARPLRPGYHLQVNVNGRSDIRRGGDLLLQQQLQSCHVFVDILFWFRDSLRLLTVGLHIYGVPKITVYFQALYIS